MLVTINGKDYTCRQVLVDIGKVTVNYGNYGEDGIENKTEIIGSPEIIVKDGELSYTVAWFKKQLADTDYVVIKIAEGAATVDDYADVIAQRQIWRDGINAIESGLS